MKKTDFGGPFIIVGFVLAAMFILSKLKSQTTAGAFTGVNSQRGLYGVDQFGNPGTAACPGGVSDIPGTICG